MAAGRQGVNRWAPSKVACRERRREGCCDGQNMDRDIRLDLRWLARTLLSSGGPKEVLVEMVPIPILTTEFNGSFYRTPSLDAVRRWGEQTPDDFIFALEGLQVHHALEAT